MDEPRMQIGAVAERAGLGVRTIRLYEESGPMSPWSSAAAFVTRLRQQTEQLPFLPGARR